MTTITFLKAFPSTSRTKIAKKTLLQLGRAVVEFIAACDVTVPSQSVVESSVSDLRQIVRNFMSYAAVSVS